MNSLQSLLFLLFTTALGMVNATASQGNPKLPFKCSSVHPNAYCGLSNDLVQKHRFPQFSTSLTPTSSLLQSTKSQAEERSSQN
ncbi:hypothetical protein PCASD_19417 [Puccinia coronata f. sp. avenae]|uniref:Uncharacterized protein n=1 Tax=Puccinia coronata f. sp. avenae TaxID=200324 RepID=A0A2N5SGC3_9BASI|nr:hypothetical protein PCASD_19417 [Puccinia coronata f. sp. avenae]